MYSARTWLSSMTTAIYSAALLAALGCTPDAPEGRQYAASVHPVAAILREVVGDRAEVVRIVPPGASPHTYDPRPSDIRLTEGCLALFYVSESLDGWAARLPAPGRFALMDYVPEALRVHYHADGLSQRSGRLETSTDPMVNPQTDLVDGSGPEHAVAHGHSHDTGDDPHFWFDPLSVRALLPALTEELARLDPDGAETYAENSRAFETRLEALHAQLERELAPVRGRGVALFHSSHLYLLNRYDVGLAAIIEPFPGKEPSPRYLAEVIAAISETEAAAVFTEPQLSRRPAEAVAEAAGVRLGELDPLGGVSGRDTYEELLLFNARALREAIE